VTVFKLSPGLFAPVPPFFPVCGQQPGSWTVRDSFGSPVASARTRAGARAAVRALWASHTERTAA
jgi:hypothetical protein